MTAGGQLLPEGSKLSTYICVYNYYSKYTRMIYKLC